MKPEARVHKSFPRRPTHRTAKLPTGSAPPQVTSPNLLRGQMWTGFTVSGIGYTVRARQRYVMNLRHIAMRTAVTIASGAAAPLAGWRRCANEVTFSRLEANRAKPSTRTVGALSRD